MATTAARGRGRAIRCVHDAMPNLFIEAGRRPLVSAADKRLSSRVDRCLPLSRLQRPSRQRLKPIPLEADGHLHRSVSDSRLLAQFRSPASEKID